MRETSQLWISQNRGWKYRAKYISCDHEDKSAM
jgi:hypothetical protein